MYRYCILICGLSVPVCADDRMCYSSAQNTEKKGEKIDD